MRHYSPNHPAVIAYRETHPPKPMTAGRKAVILGLVATATFTAPVWWVSVPCTLTAWAVIKRYYQQL